MEKRSFIKCWKLLNF